MGDKITIQGAAAGTAGAVYRKLITSLALGAGNYVLNNANFAGLGAFLPTEVLISCAPGAAVTASIQVSSDNGATWFTLYTAAAATQFGGLVWADTASTIRINIVGGTCDVRLFVI